MLELLFGVLAPAVFVVPMWTMVVIIGTLSGVYSAAGIGISLLAIGALYSLASMILFGPEQVRKHVGLHRLTLLTGLPALALCGWALWYMVPEMPGWPALLREPVQLDWETILRADDGRLVTLALAGPFLIGLAYLPGLILPRRAKR